MIITGETHVSCIARPNDGSGDVGGAGLSASVMDATLIFAGSPFSRRTPDDSRIA